MLSTLTAFALSGALGGIVHGARAQHIFVCRNLTHLMTEGLDTGENITTVGALEEELTNQSDRHLPATPSIEIQELGQNIMKGVAAMVGGIMKTGVEWKREIMVMENL